jgi:hypothetical protein
VLRKQEIEEDLMTAVEDILAKVSQLIREGGIRKLKVSHRDKVLVEIPLTAGVVGALLAPHLAALAIFSSLLTGCKITIGEDGQ